MQMWQALVLLRGEYRSRRVDGSHVQNEDLDDYALGTIDAAAAWRVEAHIQDCKPCRLRLKEARVFARLLGQLECSPERNSLHERRKEQRYEIAESATITVCEPIVSIDIRGAVVDVSRSGCRVRTPKPVSSGADVLILVKQAAVFATVRYCRATEEGAFDIGVGIDQVVMGLDSGTAIEALRSQLEASGRELQRF